MRLLSLIRQIIRQCKKLAATNFTTYAGNAAFFSVLSVVPALILLLTLLRYTSLSVSSLQSVAVFVPAFLLRLLRSLVAEASSVSIPAVISFSAVGAAWAASRGCLSLLNGLNALYGVQDRRGYLRKRLISLFYMVLLLVGIILTLALHAFGSFLMDFFTRHAPHIAAVLGLLMRLRYLLVIGFLFLLFTAIYFFFPNTKTTIRTSAPGAALATVGWLAFSHLFSFYVDHAVSSAIYGSLTMLIFFMLWLYASMNILMLGGLFNLFLRKHRFSLHALLYEW